MFEIKHDARESSVTFYVSVHWQSLTFRNYQCKRTSIAHGPHFCFTINKIYTIFENKTIHTVGRP